jgi:AcrR family transcriptional regulator
MLSTGKPRLLGLGPPSSFPHVLGTILAMATSGMTRAGSEATTAGRAGSARDRILNAAYDLICRHGVRAVGVDRIIETSGVAKMSFYRNFRSKDDLVLAVLERREERWTEDWLRAEVRRRAADPADRLVAVFDVFDGWFRLSDFEGCLFVNVVLEIEDPSHPIHRAGRAHLANIRSFIEDLAQQAGIADPEAFSRQWHILMKGSIVAAGEGDVDAALRAKAIGTLLLANAIAPSANC